MILNLDQLINHNKKMYDAFIDLKVVGWKSYSSALNDYTFGFYKKQLEVADENVVTFGNNLKLCFTINLPGVCK